MHVLDHCDKEALIEKYRPHRIAVENIEEADLVWDGRPYTELIGRRDVYDWIIASHVLEYTTDLIGFPNDCDSLLKKRRPFAGGSRQALFFRSLSRECWDRARYRHREESTEVHPAGRAAEYFLTVVSRDGRRIVWDATGKGEFKLVHSWEQAKQAIRGVSERETCLDVFESCFTPTSFRLMMHDLFEPGFIQLKELAFYPSTGSEFYSALSRSGELPAGTELELLQQVDREQSLS